MQIEGNCYTLAWVQPALKYPVCKRADVPALAGTLYRLKASAPTVMEDSVTPHPQSFICLDISTDSESPAEEDPVPWLVPTLRKSGQAVATYLCCAGSRRLAFSPGCANTQSVQS